MRHVHFIDMLVCLAPGTYPIVSGAFNNLPAAPIDLDTSRLPLHPQMPSWACNSTWHIHIADTYVYVSSGAFLGAVWTVWHGGFAARLALSLPR
jgi:hypothetical protein